jgi:hypothetical protein
MRQHFDIENDRLPEALDTLKGFCKHFDIILMDYCISGIEARNEKINLDLSENIAELSGVRLWKYIENNFSSYINQYTGKPGKLLAGECPFTGMCYDESILDPIRDFMRAPDRDTDFYRLADDCAQALLNAVHLDTEYDLSDEGLKETAEANEYQFTENGAIY